MTLIGIRFLWGMMKCSEDKLLMVAELCNENDRLMEELGSV